MRYINVPLSSNFSKALSVSIVNLMIAEPGRLQWSVDRWQVWCKDLGLNIHRTYDWNRFWSGTSMRWIMTAPDDMFTWGLKTLRSFQRESPVTPIKRSDKMMQSFSHEQLEMMLAGFQNVLQTTAAECDGVQRDYPSWYQETLDMATSIERALNPPPPVQPLVDTQTARQSLGSGGRRRI